MKLVSLLATVTAKTLPHISFDFDRMKRGLGFNCTVLTAREGVPWWLVRLSTN